MLRIFLEFFHHNLITFILLGWIKIRTIRTYSHIDRCIKFWRESLRTDGRANKQTDRQPDRRKDGWITGDHKSSLETLVKLKRN